MQTQLFDTSLFSSIILEDDTDSCNCYNCSETVDQDAILEINGDQYCVDCVCYCEYCSDPVLTENLITVITNSYRQYTELYCQDCVDSNTFYCQDCNQYFDHNNCDHHNIEDTGETICDLCRDSGDYFTCEDCYDTFSFNQYNSDEYSCYCDRCYPDHNNSSDYVLPYNTNVLDHLDFMGDPKDRLYLGIELEYFTLGDFQSIAKKTSDTLENYAILKEDSSITKPGFEIVSAPSTLQAHKQNLEHLDFSNFSTYSGLGMHIHISRKPLGDLTIGKITQFINDPNHRDMIIKLSERNSNQWAKLEKTDILSVKKQYDRYNAVNLTNSNTIELRIFKSSTDLDLILARLEFVHCLASWAKFESMQTLSWDRFASYAKDNRKAYPSLYQWLEDNARMIA